MNESDLKMWEIMVPTHRNDGEEFSVDHHQAWDARVLRISPGMTLFKRAQGIWINAAGKRYREGMIPVQVACTREQIAAIIQLTLTHYDQEAVIAKKISDEVLLVLRDQQY